MNEHLNEEENKNHLADKAMQLFLEGNSELPESLVKLLQGYGSFATYLVLDRAIISVEDGLKPSQRRILYTMSKMKKDVVKSSKLATATTDYHPHGDAPIYDTMTRMVESNNATNLPFLEGDGNFGVASEGSKAAAPRYTAVKKTKYLDTIYKEIDYVEYVPTEDGNLEEPVVLPMTVPYGLLSGAVGIAVGLACKYVPYNPNELVDAIIEFMNTGAIEKPLVPDFPSRGEILDRPKEFDRIMRTGRGSLTIRGKWRIEGKNIVIYEVPFFTNMASIMKEANKLDNVINVENNKDFHKSEITVVCKSEDEVPNVLTMLLRKCGLQKNVVTNMNALVGNEPKLIGVTEHIAEWLKFRRKTKITIKERDIETVELKIRRFELLVSLLSDDNRRNTFLEKMTLKNNAKAESYKYVRSEFPEVNDEEIAWVMSRSLSSLNTRGKDKQLDTLKATREQLLRELADIDSIIKSELLEFKRLHGRERQTELTNVEIDLTDDSSTVDVSPVVPVFVTIKDKFIKKCSLEGLTLDTSNLSGYECDSDDIIIMFDNEGRILRVTLEDIPFNSFNNSDRGTYLTNYLELEEDDYEIMAYKVLGNNFVAYGYEDGFISVVNMGEWYGNKRQNRVAVKGISKKAYLINSEVDLDYDCTLAVVTNDKGDFKLGYFNNSFNKKSRLARTRVVKLANGDRVVAMYPMEFNDVAELFGDNITKYLGKATKITSISDINEEVYSRIIGEVQ